MATLFIESQCLNQAAFSAALGSENIVSILNGTSIAVTNKGTLIDLTSME
jgi:hypothetical protein